METTRAIALMEQHQSRLIAHVEGSVALLVRPPGEVRHLLAQRRWTALKLLREYQLFKHVEVFEPTLRSGTPERQHAAHRLRADCIVAGNTYRDYAVRWSGCDIAAAWEEYNAALNAMARAIRRQLADEHARILALLHGVRRTRYPD